MSSLTSTGIIVHIMCKSVHNVLQSLREVRVWEALLQRVIEHFKVRAQGVLVHGINGCHVSQDEEQYSSSFSCWSVSISEFINIY